MPQDRHPTKPRHERLCTHRSRSLACACTLLALHTVACASRTPNASPTAPKALAESCRAVHPEPQPPQALPPSTLQLDPGAYYIIQHPTPHDGTPLTLKASRSWQWRAQRAEPFIPYKLTARDGAITEHAAWSRYANALHHRVHPVFVDQFIASFCAEQAAAEFDDPDLAVTIDLAVDGHTGAVTQLGFVAPKPSVLPFSLAAIEAVVRAANLVPPPELASEDGSVYFQWTLYRDPERTCSTYLIRPTEASLH
jgi:hypothetical protein